MSFLPDLIQNQTNTVQFVMVNSAGVEVTGLGGGFTLQLAKGTGAFVGSAGTKGEISNGWYFYTTVAAECDTPGPLAMRVTGVGAAQQNLAYVVREPTINAIEFTYTLTNSITLLPVQGAEIWFTTDVAGLNVVWRGETDAFGIARDENGYLPRLDAGSYSVWRQHPAYTFVDPDTEIVSP